MAAPPVCMRFLRDLSLSAVTAGFVAVLVGFTSSMVLVFQAAQSLSATPEQLASWMWAVCLGTGLCTAIPSLILRKPVMVAWSSPGAAVVAAAALAGGFGMAEAVGAFLVCGALIVLVGATGWFERVMDRIPMALASALLAGVLARFALQAVGAATTALPLVLAMLAAYLLARRWVPRYAVVVTLGVGVAQALASGRMDWQPLPLALARPVFVAPEFSWQAVVGLGLPLFVVTMASQNLPGVAAIRAAGYRMPISRLVTMTGVATLVLAPFGGYALCLSAITAAMCMGPQAHEDPARRYTAAVACGTLYVVLGLFGGAVAGTFSAFPKELVAAIAGLALLGTIGAGLSMAMADEGRREAALLTFLVTLSGVVLGGIGSAFWGLVAGTLALLVQHYRRSRS